MIVRYRHVAFVCLVVAALSMAGVPVAATPPPQGGQVIHVVQAGETLVGIARRYGTTVEAIAAANGLVDPDRIGVGQRLVIPKMGAAPATVYVVQPGDTLALIARRYGVSVEQVAQLNLLANPNLIWVGQELSLPLTGEGEGERPTGGQVYVVQAGDTLAQIAAHYGMAVWAIAQANGIANPNVVHVGQRLLIPTGAGQSSLPLPFVSIQIIPPMAVQGQTVRVIVETQGEATLDGSYSDLPLFFVGGGGQYRTLIGIHAMAAPGPYALSLKARQDDTEVSVRSMVQVVEGNFGAQILVFPEDKAGLLDADRVAQEAQRIWAVTTQVTLPARWQGPFGLPLSGNPPISAPFGVRRSYQSGPSDSRTGGETLSAVRFHSGVDYGVPEGTAVYCPAAGKVVLAEALQVRGNAIIVDHGRGVMSGYWHLSQFNVAVGQEVRAGDLLGLVGNTGLSTGAHLHWEMSVMGIQVDPLQWVRENVW